MNKRQLENYLRQQGCVLYRQGAGHEIWMNLELRRRAPLPRHREVRLHTALAVCRQLGVPPPPFK